MAFAGDVAWGTALKLAAQCWPAVSRSCDGTYRAVRAWLSTSAFPKLFVRAEPGSILIGRAAQFWASWANQREITVHGIHFLQEDSPDEIGAALVGVCRLSLIVVHQPPSQTRSS